MVCLGLVEFGLIDFGLVEFGLIDFGLVRAKNCNSTDLGFGF